VSLGKDILKHSQNKVTFSISITACLGFLSENENQKNKTLKVNNRDLGKIYIAESP